MSEENNNVRLPSGRVIELQKLNGAQWKQCLYNARKLSQQQGTDMGEIGYWEKYLEFATGLNMTKLESWSAEDYQYLLERLMKKSKVGPNGARETEQNQKN